MWEIQFEKNIKIYQHFWGTNNANNAVQLTVHTHTHNIR